MDKKYEEKYNEDKFDSFDICDEDKKVMKNVWRELSKQVTTENSIKITYNRCLKFCRYLQNSQRKPLKQWKEKEIELFLRDPVISESEINRYSNILTMALNLQGIEYDVKKIEREAIEEKIENYFPDFNTFDATLLSKIKQVRPYDDPVTGMNKYSSAKAIVYLIWLGLAPVEISQLKKSDYHEKERYFEFEGKTYSFASYPTMVAFFKAYSEASGYYTERSSTGNMFFHYVDSNMFIRSQKASKQVNARFMMRTIREEFGITYEQVHWSGCFERIYDFEQRCPNKELTKDNIDDIKFIIGSEAITDKKGYHFKYGIFMRRYNKYKKIRSECNNE